MSSTPDEPHPASPDKPAEEEASGIDRERLADDARAFGRKRKRDAEADGGDEDVDDVQEASEESFPASDPPAFTPAIGTGPKRREK